MAAKMDPMTFHRERLNLLARQYEQMIAMARVSTESGAVAADQHQQWYQRLGLINELLLSPEDLVRKELLARGSPSRGGSDAERCSQMRHDAALLSELLPKVNKAAELAEHNAYCVLVKKTLQRFGHIAHRMAVRSHEGVPILIRNEYDAQYLLNGLLAMHFEDIRPEDPVPIESGASSRIDFVLKREKIAIELKFVHDSYTEKKLGEQLATDVVRYAARTEIKTLFFLIYDPARQLRNPAWLLDARREEPSPRVRVVVSH